MAGITDADYNTAQLRCGWTLMLDKLWRRLMWPAVMRDADRLIAAHGRGAYGMARLGANAAREIEGCGHWSSVAHEIARRLEREHDAAVPEPKPRHPGDDVA